MSNLVNKILKDPIEVISNLSIEELEEVIIFTNDKYRNDTPVISDAVYDLLIDFLENRNPKSSILKQVGAEVKSKNKVILDYTLASMNKIKPSDLSKLEDWIKNYKAPYYISDKLDGISALLIYTTDKKIKLFTRGNGIEGQDISNLIKYLQLPTWEEVNTFLKKKKIKTEYPNNIIALRGELIIPNKVFETNWANKLKNARNAVSGLGNSKHVDPDLAKDTNLVLYEIVDPPMKIEDQFITINELGFKSVKYKKFTEINFEILSDYFLERRTKSNYTVDGIIVTNNEKHERNIDTENPKYAFAFKDVLEDQKAESKIINIEWKVSKNGYLNPTVVIEPVSVGGVEIKRATANNAKFVVDNGLGKGAIIEIIRSGDVIPKIIKVIKKVKPGLPKGNWYWNDTETDIITEDKLTDEITIRNIHFFFASLNTKGLGEKNIEKMFEAGLDSIEKILKAKEKDLLEVEGFKEKTASNIISAIKDSLTDISLPKLMAASNKLGEGIGERKMKPVLDKYPNLIKDYKKWSKNEFIDKIKEINGWEEKTSTVLVDNFDEFIKFYEKIKSFLTLQKEKKIKESSLTGKIMVLSGFRDPNLQEMLESIGVKLTSAVSKNTDYLVVKDKETIEENTGKVQKANELEIKIITKDALLKLIN